MECGSLNVIAQEAQRMVLVGGVVLLEEVCHCGGGHWGLVCSQAMSSVSDHFLLPTDQDIGLLAPFTAPCLPAMPCHDDNGLNL